MYNNITRRRFMGDSLLAAKAACLGSAFLPEFLNAQEQSRPLYKSRYHIIDAHTHCGAPHDDSVPAQLDIMSQAGVNKFVVLLFDTLEWQGELGVQGIKLWKNLGMHVRDGSELVLSGAKLPPEVLEKFYHINAEKLIPGIKKG